MIKTVFSKYRFTLCSKCFETRLPEGGVTVVLAGIGDHMCFFGSAEILLIDTCTYFDQLDDQRFLAVLCVHR